MKATEQLKAEHEGILLMLRVLERISQRLQSGESVSVEDLERIVEFLRIFVDQCHHGKEEDMLFPSLEAAGIPRRGGPIGQMLSEHEQGRGHIRGLAEAVSRYGTVGIPAVEDLLAHIRNYTSLLRAHIDKENSVLFPLADSMLSAERQEDLFNGFERLEEKRIGVGKHEEFHRLLDELAGVYLV